LVGWKSVSQTNYPTNKLSNSFRYGIADIAPAFVVANAPAAAPVANGFGEGFAFGEGDRQPAVECVASGNGVDGVDGKGWHKAAFGGRLVVNAFCSEFDDGDF
jgi:hypothetical protein